MKYHIFIGSALDDLKDERREILRVIMEMGHIPVTAEYLNSKARNYDKLLVKTIEDCDYFIAVIAHKYAPKGVKISPLESECNIANKKNVPIISLIIDGKARWKSSKKEKSAGHIKKVEELKKKLKHGSGISDTWLNSKDLCRKLENLLNRQINLEPRNGWVRADQTITPSIANELSRLSIENEQLKQQLKIESGDIDSRLREHLKNALKVLALNKVTLSFFYLEGENWENSRSFRYLRIFKLLIPELAAGKTTAEISRFLGAALNPEPDKPVRKDYPTPPNTIKKIMADLSLLKLVRCVDRDENADDDEVWEITEYGKELYSAYRVRRLKKSLIKTGS